MSETVLVVGVRKLGRTIALHFARRGWRVLSEAIGPSMGTKAT